MLDKVIQLYTYMQSFKIFLVFFPIMVDHRILNIVFLLFIHPVYNSLHVLNPTISFPQAIPLGNHMSALCACESVSASWIGSFVSYFRFHI